MGRFWEAFSATYSHGLTPTINNAVERRLHKRYPADFEVRVTSVDDPDLSASGRVIDISQYGICIYLPLQLTPGTAIRLNLNDGVLHGFVAHSTPERSYFRTGIEVVQVLIGGSDLSQLLKATLKEVLPEVELVETLP